MPAELWTLVNRMNQSLLSDEIDGSGNVVRRRISAREEFEILSTAVGPAMKSHINNGLLSVKNIAAPPEPSFLVFQPSDPVTAATTENMGSATYDAEGGTLETGSFASAPTTVDGHSLSNDDRVLVKNQSDAKQNGIYRVVSSGNWERASDMDTSAKTMRGIVTNVQEGSANGGKAFVLKSSNPLILNTSEIEWIESPFAAGGGGDFEWDSGTMFNRPNDPVVGQMRFNTTANIPEWWNGSMWVDASGEEVSLGD